jgi:hypothetical protein
MRQLIRALLVCTAILSALIAIPTPSHASSGEWVVTCGYVRALPDDPIVRPKQPGASHMHDFIGNTTVDAFSTYQSMEAGSSTCPAGDRAGYWVPSLYRNGVKVDPTGSGVRQQVYYTAGNLSTGTHIEPFPPDMRIVAGNGLATSAQENPKLGMEIYWGCSDNSTGKLTVPPSSCTTGILSLHVGFPNCWDGTLTHVNDTSHLRYPEDGKCPSGFSHALPRVIMRMEYPVGSSTGTITLASGAPFTAHGDFWNTWDQAKLNSLVDNCLNADKDCGVFQGTTSGSTASTTSSSEGDTTATTTTTTTSSSTSTTVTKSTRRHHRPHTSTTRESVLLAASADEGDSSGPTTTAASPGGAQAASGGASGEVSALVVQSEAAIRSSGKFSGKRSRLPLTGTPISTAAALAVSMICLGAAFLLRTRKPRPRH